MTVVDYAILGLLLVSVVLGLMRGFVREVLSLVSWVGAAWLAVHYTPDLSDMLVRHIESLPVRKGVSFAVLFLGALLTFSVIAFIIGRLVKATGLGAVDRFFGMLFGAARGAVVILVAAYLAHVTPFPEKSWWRESKLLPQIDQTVAWMEREIPDELKRGFASQGLD